MTEEKLVPFTQNLMKYLVMEVEGKGKVAFATKIQLIDSVRGALRIIEKMPDRG